MRNFIQLWRRYRNKISDLDLHMYEAIYLGNEKKGTITGQIVSHISSHSFNMGACGIKTKL
jgi:hypothetical protein